MNLGNMRTSRVARTRLLELVQALQPQINSSSIHTPVPHASAVYAAAAAVKYTTSTSTRGSNGSGGSFGTAGPAIWALAAAAAAVGAAGTAATTAGYAEGCGQQQQQQLKQQESQQQQRLRLQQQQQPVPWQQQLLQSILQPLTAAADAPQQQQQQQQQPPHVWAGGPGGGVGQSEPLSGAIAALDEQGLTNHPLDYNPITNEHTAAMTLAKQAGIEAYQAGRYAEAERRFKEALVEARAGFPPNDPHIPSALHYLAEFYRNLGQLDKAEPLYRETISHLSDSLGERHWMYSAALCSLAALHEARRDYTQAIELLESALELRRQLFSNSSFLYADTAALLAKTLMQQHTAAVAEAAAAAAEAGSSGSSWYGRLTGSSSSSSSSSQGSGRGGKPSGPPDVLRAIGLWQQAIKIVEDSGSVVDTPVVPWLLDLAEAQQTAAQPAAAVDSLQKALDYMALPQQQQQQQQEAAASSSSSSSEAAGQQQQQGQLQQLRPGSSSNSGVDGVGDDVLTSVLGSCGGNVELARLKLSAMASEVAERLVDAQLAAGDLQGARKTLRQALEARIALLGRHLVVAKTMTRLANLLMEPPPDPSAQQLAPHFAASAVAIADTALQTAQRANLWQGMVRGALKAVQTASFGTYKAGLQAERTCDRLLAALQLGNASLALAAAEKMNGRLAEAESALRHGVVELRWVLGVGANDLQMLSSSRVEPALLQRAAGLLVDLKLLQMDCLEGLAAALREAAATSAAGKKHVKKSKQAAAGVGGVEPEEVSGLLAEAEQLAAELVDE